MISRYEVVLNNVSMADLNENLLILDVSHEQPKFQRETVHVAGREGLVIENQYRETASVTITFELHIYGIAERQSALDSVISWARNGGILKTNDREGQRLVCICDKFPSVNSVKRWTDSLSITFSAYGIPYWEDEQASVITLSGKNASGNMEVSGNGGNALVSCEITARATLSQIRVNAGSSFIELSGINIPANGVVKIGYGNDGVLSIKYGNTSLMNKRTAGSSDDLVVPSGKTSTFSITASASVLVAFSVRGCWL